MITTVISTIGLYLFYFNLLAYHRTIQETFLPSERLIQIIRNYNSITIIFTLNASTQTPTHPTPPHINIFSHAETQPRSLIHSLYFYPHSLTFIHPYVTHSHSLKFIHSCFHSPSFTHAFTRRHLLTFIRSWRLNSHFHNYTFICTQSVFVIVHYMSMFFNIFRRIGSVSACFSLRVRSLTLSPCNCSK